VLSISGVIEDRGEESFFRDRPSMVQEVVSQLRLAEKDRTVRAIVLKIDSPGGTTTASDILYNEILSFKERTGVHVVAVMMNVAASGGYYVALPADYIIAHPTTITGSVGVIFMRPDLTALLEKIGVGVQVSKSGKNKDIGSPFRKATPEEEEIMKEVTAGLGKRFIDLVAKHRKAASGNIEEIATARVYMAADAEKVGLIDGIGYLEQALQTARQMAHLPKNARVVVYRRSYYADDNLYNSTTAQMGHGLFGLSGLAGYGLIAKPGFYYLWSPGAVLP
jgi:protease-4